MDAVEVVNLVEDILLVASIVVLALAGLLTMYRLNKGPTSLDRIMASDLVAGIVIGIIAIWISRTELEFGLTIMLVLSVVAFIGAVSMSRFMHDQVPTGGEGPRRRVRRRSNRRGLVRAPQDGGEAGAPSSVTTEQSQHGEAGGTS